MEEGTVKAISYREIMKVKQARKPFKRLFILIGEPKKFIGNVMCTFFVTVVISVFISVR